jgi:general stress protein 26
MPLEQTIGILMEPNMEKDAAIAESLALVERSIIAMLGTVDGNGHPNIKAMMNMEHEGLKVVWFSTNTSSKRVAQILRNPKTCVYFVDADQFKGLMLVGTIEVLQDDKSRQRLWRPGCEKYYPLGVTDPNYSVLRFTASWGNYYHGLSNITFDI